MTFDGTYHVHGLRAPRENLWTLVESGALLPSEIAPRLFMLYGIEPERVYMDPCAKVCYVKERP